MIDERRSSDKGGTPSEPATEAVEAANMRYSKTTTAVHSTKTTNRACAGAAVNAMPITVAAVRAASFLWIMAVLLFGQKPPLII